MMFCSGCFLPSIVLTFLFFYSNAEASQVSKTVNLGLKFTRTDNGNLQIHAECAINSKIDADRLSKDCVSISFGGKKLTKVKVEDGTGENITVFSALLTDWKNRLNEFIKCDFRGMFSFYSESIRLKDYAPRETSVRFWPRSPVAVNDAIQCFADIQLRPNVTIWQKGNKKKTLRSGHGSAALLVPRGSRQLEFECRAENALGSITKTGSVQIARPSIKVAFYSEKVVNNNGFYNLSCGLPSSPPPSHASISLRIAWTYPPNKKHFIIASWRNRQLYNYTSEGFHSPHAQFNGRSLQLHLHFSHRNLMRLQCRVLLANGSFGTENRSLLDLDAAKILKLSVYNHHGISTQEPTNNRSVFVNCTVQWSTKDPNAKPNERVQLYRKFRYHTIELNAVGNRSEVFTIGDLRRRSLSWVFRATRLLSAVVCGWGELRLEKKLRVRYVSKPWLNVSSPFTVFPGQSVLCSAQGFPDPTIFFGLTRWPHARIRPGVAVLTIPLNTRPASYSLECVAVIPDAKTQITALIRVLERPPASGAGTRSLWKSYQWLWVAAVILSLGFLAFSVAYWWRSQQALEQERRAQRKRRTNSANQLLELTPSPCRTPDSGFGTPETGRKKPPAAVEEGVVYAQLDFDERGESRRPAKPKRSKKSKRKRNNSSGSIVYDVIVGEIIN